MAAEADDFKLTKEEADQLREALKKEEFRKLLKEYAEEISDPVNKQRYEEDIKKLENERGMDVEFVKIKPKLVIKTTKLPSRQKLFVNIGECDHVGVATAVQDSLPNGKVGSRWSIPYTLTQPREDTDNGKKCSVIDIGFHSLTMSHADKDHRFLDLIITTAIEGVEKDRGIKVDHKHVKRMKFEYKGKPQSTVIRKKKPASSSPVSDADKGSGVAQQDPGPFKFPYPPMKEEERQKNSTKQLTKEKQLPKKPNNEPAYTIIHRGEFDMQDYTFTPISSSIKRPRELVVTVKLPKLESAATVELDIFEKRLILINKKPNYHLELNLSYPVNEDLARAKFDKSTSSLIVTLPVLPPTTPSPQHPHMTKPHTLIEPLSNDESNDNDEPVVTTNVTEPEPIKSSVRSDWSINDSWECPPFSYRQNDDCVSFVLHIAFVKENTMISHFDQDSFQVTFKGSVESSIDTLKSYSIYVQLVREGGMEGSGSIIDTSNCKVDIGPENIVVVVAKGPEQLQRFKVGPGPAKLTEKLFLTDSNVSEVCELVDTMDTWKGQVTEDLSVNLVQTGEEESVVEIVTKERSPPTNPVTMETDKSDTTNNGIEAQQLMDSGKETILKVNDDIAQNEQGGTKGESDPISNGCGFNGTSKQDANKFVKFSNDLLYDLD